MLQRWEIDHKQCLDGYLEFTARPNETTQRTMCSKRKRQIKTERGAFQK